MRYSTAAMAQDFIDVLDHIRWTGERELHVMGISMGGMIAQELALKIPERIASLTLMSTGRRIRNTVVSVNVFTQTWMVCLTFTFRGSSKIYTIAPCYCKGFYQ
jgi:pimeloyl-ACP methyl ester carboxylesterase